MSNLKTRDYGTTISGFRVGATSEGKEDMKVFKIAGQILAAGVTIALGFLIF